MALFKAIEKYGSIRQAATGLGMSYRAAWGKIKATNHYAVIDIMNPDRLNLRERVYFLPSNMLKMTYCIYGEGDLRWSA